MLTNDEQEILQASMLRLLDVAVTFGSMGKRCSEIAEKTHAKILGSMEIEEVRRVTAEANDKLVDDMLESISVAIESLKATVSDLALLVKK